ncbi:MAG: glycolate oxidase subunit GlcF [Burkholderiales bacterium]|nr:glycolate oxidase subunit GlcF [Burkholderiales bacterium]
MQTQLADFIKDTPEGREADRILRSCVHCGFCLATCPTYQLLGNELDSPRGRIYLIKQMLEGGTVTGKTLLHLDRCLTCRACETTCPSGVQYGKLIDIGRGIAEKKIGRSWWAQAQRKALRALLPTPALFAPLLKLGQVFRPWLPAKLKEHVPAPIAAGEWPRPRHARKMLVLDGCVQPAMAPQINSAAARVLDRLGISLITAPEAGCCGALSYHLNAHDEALDYMRRNIDAWMPYLDQGVEAIVMTASGCGVTVREYGYYLQNDPVYAEKAAHVSSITRDVSEILVAEKDALQKLLAKQKSDIRNTKLAVHTPCTLQHGQKINGVLEAILTSAGYEVLPSPDRHLCCGAAGTYSILQPGLSSQLLKNKVTALETNQPERIVTANIGCLLQLQSGTQKPVAHWIELIDEALTPA